jgi:hypothetical protein
MSELKGPVIIINDKTEATDCLLTCFQSIGWHCLSAENLDNLQSLCTDPLNQPVVVPAQFLKTHTFDNDFLSQFFSDYLVVVALDEEAVGNEVAYFRLGAADILEEDPKHRDIPHVFERLSKLATVRRMELEYSERLKQTNAKLNRTVQLLEQDQKAGLAIQKI